MVVPSEKNADIFSMKMEESEQKKGALNMSDQSNEADQIESPSKTIERDKSESESEPGDDHDETDHNSDVLALNDDKDEEMLSARHNDEEESSTVAIANNPDHLDHQSSSLDSDEAEHNTKDDNIVQSTNIILENDATDPPADDDDQQVSENVIYNSDEPEHGSDGDHDRVDVRTLSSTMFETINTTTTSEALDQTSAEDAEEDYKSLEDKIEIIPGTPPRLHSLLSPFLTSTPAQSLPPPRPSSPSSPRPSSPSSLLSPGLPSLDPGPMSLPSSQCKSYDYLLKVLLVGDSDVGKQEILSGLEDGSVDSPYCSSTGAAYKTTTILIDGKRVKLQIWDTSGQGRFCTIIRSYSRGAQGILLVYDITNKWSFEGMDRWVREVEEHAPGIPKVLVGNRLHLAFKRQVDQLEAESYAERNHMGFYEVSPLVNFNITESFQELSRMALKRNGMERLWRSNKVLSLHELCCHNIVANTNVYNIDKLPLPDSIKANLKSYALTNSSGLRQALNYKTLKDRKKKSKPPEAGGTKRMNLSRKSCVIS